MRQHCQAGTGHDFVQIVSTAEAETVITADQAVRGGKIIELKATVDTAVKKCPKVKRVFVSKRTGANVPIGNRDIPLEEVSPCFSFICQNVGADLPCCQNNKQ